MWEVKIKCDKQGLKIKKSGSELKWKLRKGKLVIKWKINIQFGCRKFKFRKRSDENLSLLTRTKT